MADEDEINLAIAEFISTYKGEIDAVITQFGRRGFTVKFSGAVCKNCGPEDYIQGLSYLLKLKGIDVKLVNYKEDNGAYLAEYAF